jgi:hypothetical protein
MNEKAKKTAEVGKALMGLGCAITILTIMAPIIIVLLIVLWGMIFH